LGTENIQSKKGVIFAFLMLIKGGNYFVQVIYTLWKEKPSSAQRAQIMHKMTFFQKEEGFVWRGPGPGRIQALV
jgi:hypothetical protein